eukprot:UN02323
MSNTYLNMLKGQLCEEKRLKVIKTTKDHNGIDTTTTNDLVLDRSLSWVATDEYFDIIKMEEFLKNNDQIDTFINIKKQNINNQLKIMYKNDYEVVTKMCMPNGSILQVLLTTSLAACIITELLQNNESYEYKSINDKK